MFSHYNVVCHCKTVCVALLDFLDSTNLVMNNATLIVSAMESIKVHCVSLDRK